MTLYTLSHPPTPTPTPTATPTTTSITPAAYSQPNIIFIMADDLGKELLSYPLGPKRLFNLGADPEEQVNLWDSQDPEDVSAKRRLLEILDTFPRHAAPPKLDPINGEYGMFAHWRFDRQAAAGGQQAFPDAIGGYDASANVAASAQPDGKFGAALPASASPVEAARFGNFFDRGPPIGKNVSSFTLSAWVKRESSLTGTGICCDNPRLT